MIPSCYIIYEFEVIGARCSIKEIRKFQPRGWIFFYSKKSFSIFDKYGVYGYNKDNYILIFSPNPDEKSNKESKEDEGYNVYCIWSICISIIWYNNAESKLCRRMINHR